jgi:hypothetical protein
MSIGNKKNKKKDFNINESILVDIMNAQFDTLNEKLDKLLFLSGVYAKTDLDTYQEYDNDIRVVDMR